MKLQILAIFQIRKCIKNPEISEIAVFLQFHSSTIPTIPEFFFFAQRVPGFARRGGVHGRDTGDGGDSGGERGGRGGRAGLKPQRSPLTSAISAAVLLSARLF